MSEKVKKRVAVWSLAAIANTPLIMTAVTALLIAQFTAAPYNMDRTSVMVISTISGLLAIPGSLLCAPMAKIVSQKALALTAALLFTISGLMIAVLSNIFAVILIGRCISGIAQGMNSTISTALVATHFENLEERAYVMGMRSVFINGGGMIFSLLGGVLAGTAGGWPTAFWLFLICLIPFFLVATLLKKDDPKARKAAALAKAAADRESGVQQKGGYNWGVIFVWIMTLLTFITMYVYNTNLGLKITTGLGLSNVLTGTSTMVYSLAGMLFAFFFAKVLKALKNKTLGVGILLEAIGMFIIAFANSFVLVLVGCVIYGFGYACWMPVVNVLASQLATDNNRVTVLAVVMCCINGGAFLSPIVMNPIISIFYGATPAPQESFLVGAIAVAIVAVIALFIDPLKAIKNRTA